MLGISWSSLLAASLLSSSLAWKTDFGVGFDLSLDYGITSIYFPNGTYADIAHIQGGPMYRQGMRVILAADDDESVLHTQSLRDRLPPWLGGTVDPTVEALRLMLKALKTATESWVETTVSTAEVVFPLHVSAAKLDKLHSAMSSLAVEKHSSTQPPAGVLAARAFGIGGSCSYYPEPGNPDDPAQLVLTVQYTRVALTLHLIEEDCGLFDELRLLHRMDLGVDQLSQAENRREMLLSAFRNVTSRPLKTSDGTVFEDISQLVLVGEAAGDALLHDVLKEVLGPVYTTQVRKTLEGGVDPLFAASRGLAYDCWHRIDFTLPPEL